MKHKFSPIRNLKYFIVLAVLASCATPRSVVRMEPTNQDVYWLYGKAYSKDTISGISAEVAFERDVNDMFIFNFNIENRSNLPYLVDPSTFYFQELIEPSDSALSKIAYQIPAIDPEWMLLDIDKQISQNEADEKNAAVGGAIFAGAIIATSVALAVDNDPRTYLDPDLLFAAPLVADEISDEANYQIYNLEDKRDVWENQTIRKTTLESNYSIQGQVYFKRFEKAGNYVLKIPVDNDVLEIPFKQICYYP